MDRDEEIGPLVIRYLGAFFQWNERVVRACIYYVSAKPFGDQLSQSKGDINHQFLFHQSIRPDGSSVMATVASIDHHFAELKAKNPHKGGISLAFSRSR